MYRLILNIIYVWKLNQTLLELDFKTVKFLFFPRRDLNPHHWYIEIIILSIYVLSTHAYTHVLRLSLYLPYEKR
jgi:hypothetical protein